MPQTHEAKLTDDKGITRGRVPAVIIKGLKGLPGDSLVFTTDGAGNVVVTRKKASKARAKK